MQALSAHVCPLGLELGDSPSADGEATAVAAAPAAAAAPLVAKTINKKLSFTSAICPNEEQKPAAKSDGDAVKVFLRVRPQQVEEPPTIKIISDQDIMVSAPALSQAALSQRGAAGDADSKFTFSKVCVLPVLVIP